MKKRFVSMLLAGTMVLTGLTACSSEPVNPGDSDTVATEATTAAPVGESASAEAAVSDEPHGIFRNYMTTDIDTINPHIYTASASSDVFRMTALLLYKDFPTEDGKSFEYVPELAADEPIQMDEEGKVWHIPIREGLTWQNGDAISVDDVIYSYKMLLDPIMVNSRASQLASDYITITKATDYYLQGSDNTVSWDEVGIKKIDDYTLGLELDAAVTEADIKSHFNYSWTVIVHEPTYEAGMSADRTTTNYGSSLDTYMSCGSFILKEWVVGSQFKYDRNPDYVYADKIHLANYSYQIVGDRNTALELYLNGDLDIVNLSPEAIEQYIDDPSIKRSPASSIQSLTVNHGNTNNNGILGNVNFRKALFFAVDRQSIAKMTNGIPANYLVASKCLGDRDAGLTFREMSESQEYLEPDLGYNPEKAKEYYEKALEECGLSSLTLTLQYNETSANNKAASEFLHKSLPEIFGETFTLELMAAPSSVLTTYVRGWREGDPNSFELQWRGWDTSTAAPWNGLKVYSSMYSNKNEPYYNDEFDALWEKANYDIEAKLDPAYRLELTREMEKIVLDEVAAVPVYEAPNYYLINPKVQLIADQYIPGYGFGYTLSTILE